MSLTLVKHGRESSSLTCSVEDKVNPWEKYKNESKEAQSNEIDNIKNLLQTRPNIYTTEEYDFIQDVLDDNIELIHKHIKNKININIINSAALKISLKYTHNLDLAKKLIKLGANVNAVDNNDYTCGPPFFILAVSTYNLELIKMFLEYGADINSSDDMGFNSLMIMRQEFSNNLIQVIKLLLKYGIDINHKNEYNFTAIGCAIMNGNTDAYELLIKNGANINQIDLYQENCKYKKQDSMTIDYLINSMSNIGNFGEKHLEILIQMLDLMKQINFNQNKNCYYVYQYARSNNIVVTKLLVEKYSYGDTNGKSLIECAKCGYYELVEFLLGKTNGYLPKHLNEAIICAHSMKHTNVTDLLKQYGGIIIPKPTKKKYYKK